MDRTSGAARDTTGLTNSRARWDADAFGNDQYAEVVHEHFVAYPGVRLQPSGNSGYYYAGADTGRPTFFRIDSGSETSLGIGGTNTIPTGGTIRLEISGSTLTGYLNGVADNGGTKTDSTYASGSAGMGAYVTGRLASWEGGNVGGGGGGRTTKNTRSWPLGVNVGMGWRMPA